jgi:hypothetical protein
MAQYGEGVNYVTPVGALANPYKELAGLAGIAGIAHAQRREGARAVQSGIELRSMHTKMKLPTLLRLHDEEYAAKEEELLDMVRRSVKRFVVSWNREDKVDGQIRRPVAAHLADYEVGQTLFLEYQKLTTKHMPELGGKVAIHI